MFTARNSCSSCERNYISLIHAVPGGNLNIAKRSVNRRKSAAVVDDHIAAQTVIEAAVHGCDNPAGLIRVDIRVLPVGHGSAIQVNAVVLRAVPCGISVPGSGFHVFNVERQCAGGFQLVCSGLVVIGSIREHAAYHVVYVVIVYVLFAISCEQVKDFPVFTQLEMKRVALHSVHISGASGETDNIA